MSNIAVRSIIPKAISAFAVITLALNIILGRNILLFARGELQDIPPTAKMLARLFEKNIALGLIPCIIVIAISLFTAFFRYKNDNAKFTKSAKILRGSETAQVLLWCVYTLSATSIGRSSGAALSETLALYLPLTASHTLLFFIPLVALGIGILFYIGKKQR